MAELLSGSRGELPAAGAVRRHAPDVHAAVVEAIEDDDARGGHHVERVRGVGREGPRLSPRGVHRPDPERFLDGALVDDGLGTCHGDRPRRALGARDRRQLAGRGAGRVGDPEVREAARADGGDRFLSARDRRFGIVIEVVGDALDATVRKADQEHLALEDPLRRHRGSDEAAAVGEPRDAREEEVRQLQRRPAGAGRGIEEVDPGAEPRGRGRAQRRDGEPVRRPGGRAQHEVCGAERGEDLLLRGLEVEDDEEVLLVLRHAAPAGEPLAVGREGRLRVDVEEPLPRRPAERRDGEEGLVSPVLGLSGEVVDVVPVG